MKKYVLVTCVYMLTVTLAGCARQIDKSFAADKIRTAGGHYLNDINTRAARDFVQRYSEATNVEWYKVKEGYVVKFLIDSIKHQSVYKANGTWFYTIKYYKEYNMPRDVRTTVKRVYFDYTITQIEEIRYLNTPLVYIVHLEDATTWRNVRVCEGEMEVMEIYNKR